MPLPSHCWMLPLQPFHPGLIGFCVLCWWVVAIFKIILTLKLMIHYVNDSSSTPEAYAPFKLHSSAKLSFLKKQNQKALNCNGETWLFGFYKAELSPFLLKSFHWHYRGNKNNQCSVYHYTRT